MESGGGIWYNGVRQIAPSAITDERKNLGALSLIAHDQAGSIYAPQTLPLTDPAT
jgi:hypothetical protein